MFKKRLGQNEGQSCQLGHNCPQVLEMKDGAIAVVGTDITEEAIRSMLPGPGVGPTEKVIRIPRQVFISAGIEISAA